jgi:N-acetylmuramoyl-L-alanine amidase
MAACYPDSSVVISRIFSAFLVFFLLLQGSVPEAREVSKKFLVVIDPGHGGADTGAVFDGGKTRLTEKHFTLLLARDLARELIIRGHNVILTRNEDRDVLLSDRTALANKVKADVFISIHLNSSEDAIRTGGVETFILNHATDETSRRLADLENAVLKDSQANSDSGSSNVSLIMKDLILDANLTPSKDLACSVQSRIRGKINDRGVKQALFYVLLGADMPSILIESGFMNSKEDRDRILYTRSRLSMAADLAAAVDDYRLNKKSASCQVQSEKQFQRKAELPRPKNRI